MRPTYLDLIIGCLSLAVLSACERTIPATNQNPTDYHSRIKAKEVRNSLLFQPIHGSSGNYNALVIDGKEFKNTRGFPPYYLDLPEQKRIVFATGTWGPEAPALIHIFDFNSNTDLEFKIKWGEGSSFGDGIHQEIKGERNYIENATSEEIVLVDESLSSGTMRKIILDLKNRAIREVDWFIYDGQGHLTNSFVTKY